jgi:metal-sulfur cluster biosynthetic enzyme
MTPTGLRGEIATTVASEDVRSVLNSIIDPCSAAAGTPAGLSEMGLVRAVNISEGDDGANIQVTLAVTHPFCMMAAVFVNESRIRLSELPGVNSVEVSLDGRYLWSEDDFEPAYAARRRQSLQDRGLINVSTEVPVSIQGVQS